MLARPLLVAAVVLAAAGTVWGQSSAAGSRGTTVQGTWRTAGDASSSPETASHADGTAAPEEEPVESVTGLARRLARVTTGSGTLPNDRGQLWREYDISPYTLRVTSTNRPEQAVVDWILRETGYEAWHTEPLGILSATQRKLLVYHTPEMQQVVGDIVDRFVASEAETHAFSVRIATVNHPNWRARAQRLLRPVQVQTPGVQAWLLQKEDATILLAELQRRSDYREHSSPNLLVNNGQSTVVSATRGRNYVRGIRMQAGAWPGFEPETGVIDEGYALEFSPLLSLDGRTVDAIIKCEINQVEKMIPIVLDVPTAAAPRQRTQIETPQISQFRFHERFRWPVDQVLLVGMGMVPLPVPADGKSLLPGIPLPLPMSPPRADLLVFVESKGKVGQASRVTRSSPPSASPHVPTRY